MTSATLGAPDVLAGGRWWPGDELDAMARSWLAAARAALDETRPVAVALPTSPEGVALLVGLSSLPAPVALLPPEPRAWRSEPAIPAGTPLVLPPTLAHLAPEAEKLGLSPVVLPEASTRGDGPPLAPFGGGGVVMFTSGSTGRPKPTFYSMAACLHAARTRGRSMGLGPGAGVAMAGSPAYGQGFRYLLSAAIQGAPLALLDPHDYRQAIAALAEPVVRCWRASRHLVDALVDGAVPAPARVPPMCILGTPVPAAVFDAFVARFGVPLRQGYSSTETGPITVDDSPAERVQRETVGRPFPEVEVRVGEHPDEPAAPDRIGRIWVRSPWQMAGYGFDARAERPGDVAGWWPTRDLGALRPDGYLVLAGRIDDAIRTRDNRMVNLAYVAARLREIGGVAEAVVIAIDTPQGPSFGAVVEGDGHLTVATLRARLADVLPPWSWPRLVEVVPGLPRLPNGKPDRQACVRLLAG